MGTQRVSLLRKIRVRFSLIRRDTWRVDHTDSRFNHSSQIVKPADNMSIQKLLPNILLPILKQLNFLNFETFFLFLLKRKNTQNVYLKN